jgi:type 1 glutamine amidotransferase
VTRNLLIHGGIYHPFAEAAGALAAALDECGITSELTDDVEGGLAKLAAGGYDLLTVYALRWRMLDDPKYAPFRAQYAMSLSEAGQSAISGFVAGGGSVLALHTATICFGDWPGWGDIVGARWKWGQSFHPPEQNVHVHVVDAAHPVTAGLADFTVDDEIFHDLEPTTVLRPLLSASATPDAPLQPLCWARDAGRGRVVYDALGHSADSVRHPSHRRLLQQAARWLCAARDRSERRA